MIALEGAIIQTILYLDDASCLDQKGKRWLDHVETVTEKILKPVLAGKKPSHPSVVEISMKGVHVEQRPLSAKTLKRINEGCKKFFGMQWDPHLHLAARGSYAERPLPSKTLRRIKKGLKKFSGNL